ncbi:hypothetical protein [Corynebacterium glyciniphilum]|uniref:hypothetical protein n=1 Tax=Corynebacterium glyciniphilum TaxID=1404244 RepID=UPI00264AFBA2|nr:hypothetical protein [Corynebacterium glyciniphilum]MDN5683214.1 hypothetical protein [Corynebacterium glyciniphilum]MDN6704933.1 hypothetical protein [Corynebacterium glyciniphilum]
MTMDNYSDNPVTRRKADVRKRSRSIQVSGGIAVAGGVLAVLTSATALFLTIAVVALVVLGWNVVKVREVLNHKDQW